MFYIITIIGIAIALLAGIGLSLKADKQCQDE